MLKPGVTAEDLANRLLGHKLQTEHKIKMQQQQREEEIKALQQLHINSQKNEKLVGSNFAPIYDRVENELQKKQSNLESLQHKVASERRQKEAKQ